MTSFLRGCRDELKKVIWPDREEVFNSTVVVLIAVAIISLFLFFTDSVFETIFETLIRIGLSGREEF